MGFDTFLGNPRAVSALREMIARGALPGALLLAGPEGVGKKTLATMLARALNCERMKDDFCGQCRSCVKASEMLDAARADLEKRREIKDAARRVEGLVYFDVQLVEPLTHFILIDQIRALRRTAYTRPFELRERVFVVDQAQSIHWQAVDLLLKVMEEPPPTTLIILICPNPSELRPTIRSRCHRVSFLPVEDATLRNVLESEKKIPAAQLELAVRVAGGSVASAKTFDFAAYQERRKPWIDFMTSIASKNFRSMNAFDWKNLFDATKLLAENRGGLDSTLHTGYLLLRDVLRELETPARGRLVNVDLGPRIKSWAGKLGLEGVESLKQGLDRAYRLQTRNVNQQLGWDTLATEVISDGPE